jgi:predicted ester cyclase
MNQGCLDVLDVLDEIYTARMAAAARAWIAPFRASFPDVHMQVVDLIAEGDKVAARFLCSGTQRGEWQGHPATGQRFERIAEVYFSVRVLPVLGLEQHTGVLAGRHLLPVDREVTV